MNKFLPSPGLTGAKRRIGTNQRTQLNVQTCLVIFSSHGRPSVVVTPRVKMVVTSRTSSVCIIISLTVCILLLRIIFLVRSQTASEIKKTITPGWNDFVKAAHSDARDAFKCWIRSNKPTHVEVFNDMQTSRAKFKYLLRQCKRNDAPIRADILARDLCKKDHKLFRKNVSKQNNSSTNLADTVGGATGRDTIASMWSSHFSQLINCVTCDRHKNYTMEALKLTTNDYDTFTPGDINRSIASLCSDKACGKDVLLAEHLLHASPNIHFLLSICFNAFIVHGFLPNPLTDTVLVPIVKTKTKNISDKGNYRPIALASVVSKVFEMSLRVKLESFLHSSDYQFGFKANHSTDLCIYTLKEVIDFYKFQSTSIYVCFMDASKARRTYSRLHLFTTRLNCREPIGSRPCSVHCPDYITTRSTPSDSLNAADVYAPWCHLVFRHASVMTAVVIGCYLKSGESRFSWGIC